MYELREYQEECVKAAINFIAAKHDAKKGIIVAPTGAGKSLIIAGIVRAIASPVLVIQPSKELLMQNYEKYTSYGNKASIYSASMNSKEVGHVTFATPGSIKNDAEKFKQWGVKVILMDECHLGGKGTSMIGTMIKKMGKVKVIGLTATPLVLLTNSFGSMLKLLNRTRKSFYNKMLHIVQVEDIVSRGFWAKLKYDQYLVNKHQLKINTSGAEFSDDSLRQFYENNDIQGLIKNLVNVVIPDERKSILIFVPSVTQAIDLAKQLGAVTVWGNMPTEDRDAAIKGFKDGTIRIVVNVNVLSVGFDMPSLSCIIDATPTLSFGRYYQKLGRACRPSIGKEDALLIDLAGNYDRFGELETLQYFEHETEGWCASIGGKLITGVSLAEPDPRFIKYKYKKK